MDYVFRKAEKADSKKIEELFMEMLRTIYKTDDVEGYEEGEENLAVARSYREAPDIDGSIFVENAAGLKPGDFIRVRIEQGFAYEVVASRL